MARPRGQDRKCPLQDRGQEVRLQEIAAILNLDMHRSERDLISDTNREPWPDHRGLCGRRAHAYPNCKEGSHDYL